jgi:antitoxin VapB
MPVTTRVFRTNKTQAVRLPKNVAFPAGVEEVEVLVVGEARLITPKGRRWSSYFAEGPFAEADFMTDRAQPDQQERETL